jgi:pyruvate dehydrogenase E2 component (dihydrolipoamide acetyltransferase)
MTDGPGTTTDEIREFAVPDLGEGLEDATVVAWHVEVGSRVELNAPLCTLETAKAEVEVPSPFAGTLVEQGGSPGDTLAVGTMLARIDVGGGEAADHHAVLVGYGVDDADGSTDGVDPRQIGGAARVPVGPRGGPAAHPGPVDGIRSAQRQDAADQAGNPSTARRVLAKPPVRKLARQLGLELSELSPGSGPDGIVTKGDVEAAADGRRAGSERRESELVRLSGVRAVVAQRMADSRATIPDATCSVEVECTRLLALRDLWRSESPAVTPFAILCRLLVEVVKRHPTLNAAFVDEGPAVRLFPWVHLGVATATDRGLVVPVVRDADRLSSAELIDRIADAVERARAGTLPPADLVGSTFTVSNFGSFGIDDGIPVINPPESGVLGVGAIKPRAVVVDEQVVARPMVRLTLAFDHRVCDGADAGAFLADLHKLVERPELALLYA